MYLQKVRYKDENQKYIDFIQNTSEVRSTYLGNHWVMRYSKPNNYTLDLVDYSVQQPWSSLGGAAERQ